MTIKPHIKMKNCFDAAFQLAFGPHGKSDVQIPIGVEFAFELLNNGFVTVEVVDFVWGEGSNQEPLSDKLLHEASGCIEDYVRGEIETITFDQGLNFVDLFGVTAFDELVYIPNKGNSNVKGAPSVNPEPNE